MPATKRIVANRCCGVVVDLQDFFLRQIDKRQRDRVTVNTGNFIRLLDYFQIPLVITLERPLELKGTLPNDVGRHLSDRALTFEKNYFDLTKDTAIARHLAGLKRRQAIVAGCETDVCVLQSCLGLVDLGYEVYIVEELIFSSARNVDAALARMRDAGVTFTSYKTLFYELIEAVEGDARLEKKFAVLGPFPEDLPDTAVR